MRYNRSVGIVYQTIELFVAVVMLMIAGWRAVISIDSKIDGLKKELKTDIDRVDAKVDRVRDELRDEIKKVDAKVDRVDAKVDRVNDRIDSVANSLHSEIQNITLEVGKVIGRAETGVNAQ